MMWAGISYVIKSSRASMSYTEWMVVLLLLCCSTPGHTHPYCLPTIFCAYETCAAGGGESKVYRPRLPLDPDEVVCGRCKSVISHDLPLTPIYNPFMGYPVFAIPEPVMGLHISDADMDRLRPLYSSSLLS